MLCIREDNICVVVQYQIILWCKKRGLVLGKRNRCDWLNQVRRVKKRVIDISLMFKILDFYFPGWVYLQNQLSPILVNCKEDKIVIVFLRRELFPYSILIVYYWHLVFILCCLGVSWIVILRKEDWVRTCLWIFFHSYLLKSISD